MSDLQHLSESDLPRLLDNETTAEEARHLEVCAECGATMARFRGIDNDLIRWGKSTDARQRRNPVPSIVAAAIAAGLAVSILVPRKQPVAPSYMAPKFVAIPFTAPLDPRENATIVRMDIRVAVLNSAGFRIMGDPSAIVTADVLVGEDGLAHAIRVLNDIDLIGD
jgi:hypothetical protein